MGEIRRRDDCADPASYRLYLQGADSSQAMQDQSMTTETSDRIIRIKTVLKCTGLSRSTLYRKIDEGKFPKQVRIATRRSEEHTSELQSLMGITYAVFSSQQKKQSTKT